MLQAQDRSACGSCRLRTHAERSDDQRDKAAATMNASMANQIVAKIQALVTTGDQQQRLLSLVQQIIGVVATARLSATQVSVAAAMLAPPPATNTPPAPPSSASVAPTASNSHQREPFHPARHLLVLSSECVVQ